ncbi:odorant receptor 67c-like [Teleopsis dalmanni]|uniref:odorant receptor 67c-like n=1 Tax=Teleopsis dalmanni TaxID=139649 RepID=UPI0018CD55D2|nr:odorant receptor 67c-like [Teleopsis dalmanni]XP_037932398.1 odorant receptor 67c-like [Teleopsis dalmanni]
MPHLRSYHEFIDLPIIFYKTIGEEIYAHRSTNKQLSLLYVIYFYVGFINFNLLSLAEGVYFVNGLKDPATQMVAFGVAPCIGFSFMVDFKQGALAVHKKILRKLLDELEAIFPSTTAKQEEYKLHYHERLMRRIMIVFSMLCLAYTSTFSFYPLFKSVVRYILGMGFERKLGFYTWYPFNTTEDLTIFWLTYLTQIHGAYLAGAAFLSLDLLLIASVTQLCMHFDNISKCLEEFVGAGKSDNEHIKFLQEIVQRHAKCLELTEQVNSIFNFSLLLNFLTASLTICFIGFQLTNSTWEDIFKYVIFLSASLLQVFVVCYCGDGLISSSQRVGDAAYNQDWVNCSVKYKRMLVYLIERSQKPASIRAPTFPPISFNTYMKVISMSYQFFALLRTTYGN